LEVVALRSVPIYAVGAALASSLAVTAIAAARLLHIRLSGPEWGAVGAVCGGLAMLALASDGEGNGHGAGSTALRVGVLCTAVGIVALGDRTRPGLEPLAVAGFALAVAGALALARFGEGGALPEVPAEADAERGTTVS